MRPDDVVVMAVTAESCVIYVMKVIIILAASLLIPSCRGRNEEHSESEFFRQRTFLLRQHNPWYRFNIFFFFFAISRTLRCWGKVTPFYC